MDPENFLEIANQVTKLRMYPYFEMAHCIISCLYMREDLAQGEHDRLLHNAPFAFQTESANPNRILRRQSSILPKAPAGLLDFLHVLDFLRRNTEQFPAGRTDTRRFQEQQLTDAGHGGLVSDLLLAVRHDLPVL